MLGYVLFVVPMVIAFVWIRSTHGAQQALLDLLAFNLLFGFDFAAVLPGNTQLLVVHLLLMMIVGLEFLKVLSSGKIRATRLTLLLAWVIAIFLGWLTMAAYVNKIEAWGVGRVTNYVARAYLLNVLFAIVGIRLAKRNSLGRFGKIVFVASALVGLIAVIQTASGGALLTHDYSDRYLGVFQPLGDKAIERRDLSETTIGYVDVVRTIRFGDLSFYRAPGTFDGAYVSLCVAAIITLCLLLLKEKTVSPWLFVPFTLSGAAFVAGFNRTAIVTFALVAMLVLLVRFRSIFHPRVVWRWLVPVLFIGVISLAYAEPIAAVVKANLDGFFGDRGEREVGSLNGRSSLWAYVVSEIQHSPILGSGKPITLYRANWGVDNNPELDVSAHNSFLEVAYRGGVLPAVILLLLFGFGVLRSLYLSRSKAVPLRERSIFFALSAGTLALFILNLTAALIIVPQVAALFWILCGYLAAYTPGRTAHRKSESP